MFEYRAIVARVIDGDTIVADVDLGFGVWLHEQHFRLLGLNAREHTDPGGREATANLTVLVPAGAVITLISVKPDKYGGRYDASITLSDGRVLNHLLVDTEWAAAWSGAGAKPVPPWPRTAV